MNNNEQQCSVNNPFGEEVCNQLKYYVYELIDPRNGQVFYIGKGKRNRVFDHAKGVIIGNNNFSNDQDDEVSLKVKQIQEILNAGLQVIYIIVRWGLSEKTAYEIEATLIDITPGLTNIQCGHNPERGITDVGSLIKRLSAEEYEEPDFNYMIIKTTQKRIDQCGGDIYEATRYCWKVKLKKAKKYDYVFSVVQGIVIAVYEKVDWKQVVSVSTRCEFEAKEASSSIWNEYVGKRIPDKYKEKGNANPVLYKK